MTSSRLLLLAPLLLAGCTYDYADSYAPQYPPGYDAGMGSGQFEQPGDLFGGRNVASIEAFYGPLAPYGRWVDSRFGRAFQPAAGPDWRPYVNGRWGENRLWISDDPWGWATDHYGRWGHDERLGWVWMPDTQWAPSWVAWREDEAQDIAGWAPIPPGVAYSIGVGFGGGFGSGYGGGYGYDNWNNWYAPSWIWVPRRNLYQPGFGGGILPARNGQDYWRRSRWNDHNDGHGRPGGGPGWNGRPGGGPGWNGRPGGGPGWNGRPGGPGWNGRPDSSNPRPGYGRPGPQGRPGYGNPVGGSVAALPSPQNPGGNWQGRPRGTRSEPGEWQGNGRPPGQNQGQYQGRPRSPYQGQNPGQYQAQNPGSPGGSRPPRGTGTANLGESPGGQRPAMGNRPPPSLAAPPQQRAELSAPPQPRAAPPPRAERPPAPRSAPATIDRSAERPD